MSVTGIGEGSTRINAEAFIRGTAREIELKKDRENKFDRNAILVIGHFKQNGKQHILKLGFIPADCTKEISDKYPDIAIGATLKVMYAPTGRKGPGIRLDIWAPRAKKHAVVDNIYDPNIKVPRDKVERNLEGSKLEKIGLIDNAIEFYQANVKTNFDGNHPYDRLAMIYRKRKQYDKEIEILEKAIWIFEHKVHKDRSDRIPKIEKFKKRLSKATEFWGHHT